MNKSAASLCLILSSCHAVLPPQNPQFDRYARQIIFVADPDNQHETKDHGAIATYVENQPRVFYNPAWFSSMPEEAQIFFFQHEVAHFRLRHLDNWHASISQKRMMKKEMQADCHAMMYLQNKLRYTPSQFAEIYDFTSFYLEEERTRNLVNCLR